MDYKIIKIAEIQKETEIEETTTSKRVFKLGELEDEIKMTENDISSLEQVLQKLLSKKQAILDLLKG